MNHAGAVCSSSGFIRHHSAPISAFASSVNLCDDHGLHMSADANLRSQMLLPSFLPDDFDWQQKQKQKQRQQQQIDLPVLESTFRMLQPHPVAAENHLMVAGSVCEGSPSSVDPIPCFGATDCDAGGDSMGYATSGWIGGSAATAAAVLQSLPLPATPPKSRLLRHSSSPATFLRRASGEFHAVSLESRQKLRQRMDSGIAGGYDQEEPFPREESSSEIEELAQFGRNSHAKKRFRAEISHGEGQISENATIPKQLIEGLLPCNTTPCLARAKRGFATHPRSISERLRRTRISEGIKKLQELVPNIHKQMNTSDMLDEAVEYIKCLQRQVQELSKKQITSSNIYN